MLAQQFLQRDFCFFDFRGIELAFDAQTDFAFLEAVENVRFRNGVNSVITNTADLWTLFHIKDDNFTVGDVRRVFDAEFYVFKKLRVPKSLKIAAQGLFVVHVAFATEDARD